MVRSALRLLELHEQERQDRLEELRKEIQKGLDSGPATPMTADTWTEIHREVNNRWTSMAK